MTGEGQSPQGALLAALAEAAALLEAGDLSAAEVAMARVVGRCGPVSAGQLDGAGIAAARELLERCRRAEAQHRKRVVAAMAETSVGRKAHRAYGR